MATKDKTGTAGPAAALPAESHGFGLAARLMVDPSKGVDPLVLDALCLLNAGVGVLDAITESIGTDETVDMNALWGAVYLLRQAHAVIKTAAGTAA
jgi:hypothetical protein